MSDSEKHNVRLSKSLSWLLRHNLHLAAEVMGKDKAILQEVQETGFVDVEAVLRLPRFSGYCEAQVKKVVELNDKQRFTLRKHPQTGKLQIRANQGHTVKGVNPDLKPVNDLSELPIDAKIVHGTFSKFWPQIKATGLSRMKRNHIHFAKGLPGDKGVISGMKQDCQIHIFVDVQKAIEAGYKFYESSNGVILCPGNDEGFLPTQFFKKVIDRRSGKSLEF